MHRNQAELAMTLNQRELAAYVAALAAVILLPISKAHAAETARAEPIVVESVVLRLIEEAEVSAQEAGLITAVPVREGQRVKQGELLAQIDDQVAKLAMVAAQAQHDIARAKAANDVRRRFAKKALEVAQAELRRSTESIERFAKSVSQSQLDVERLTVEKNQLEAEQAEHEHNIAALELKAKENELTAARTQVARRQILAPFDGVIVQTYARRGEWVEPGQKTLRIVNVDRLKAEGFIPSQMSTRNLSGAAVALTVDDDAEPTTAEGTVVFVSPEVDPITGQVRVWAEIDNREGRLRPGQPARMMVGDRP
jgi:macrolide-specific efflux system membrane fusion protein